MLDPTGGSEEVQTLLLLNLRTSNVIVGVESWS